MNEKTREFAEKILRDFSIAGQREGYVFMVIGAHFYNEGMEFSDALDVALYVYKKWLDSNGVSMGEALILAELSERLLKHVAWSLDDYRLRCLLDTARDWYHDAEMEARNAAS